MTDGVVSRGIITDEAKRATTWRGDSAIHAQHMVDLAEANGIKTTDDEGHYIGLTYAAIEALMVDHATLKAEVDVLRQWLDDHTPEQWQDRSDVDVVKQARTMMELARSSIIACWPIIRTMWQNVSYALTQAGVLPK